MITAIGVVIDVSMGFQAGPGGSEILSYFISFNGNVSDGTVTAAFGTSGQAATGPLSVPATTKINKIDRLVREAMAAACFSATTVNVTPPVTGFVIDPDDIYIPFS